VQEANNVKWYDDLTGLDDEEGYVVTSDGLLYWYGWDENYLDVLYINGAGLRDDLRESARILGEHGVEVYIYPEEMDESHVDLYKIDNNDFNLN
jgi:hypothetical protein